MLATQSFFRQTAKKAEGGTVTSYDIYQVHTFTAGGTFEITGAADLTMDILVVGGGGAGGWAYGGGGGSGGMWWVDVNVDVDVDV